MRPPGARTASRWETQLEMMERHSALGPSIRFYLRRREQLLYLAVGGWNTLFGYAVWALMQYLLGAHLHYLIIILLAWPVAVLNAYLGYRLIVFRSRAPIRTEFPRFATVYVATLLVNLALLPVALATLPFNIYVIQAVFTAVVVVLSYLSHKFFSFGRGRRDALDARAPTESFIEPGD